MDSSNRTSAGWVDNLKNKTRRKLSKPLLCQECQSWNGQIQDEAGFSVWNTTQRKDRIRSLEELSHNVRCCMCQAIASAVNTRLESSESHHSWPKSGIMVRNDGPLFLDRICEFSDAHFQRRVDISGSKEAILRLLISIDVDFVLKDSLPQDDIPRALSPFSMTAQFLLRYSMVNHRQLRSLEPWEFPFFDALLLRKWVQGCESLHGTMCTGNENQNIAHLPPDFRVIDVHNLNVVKPTDLVRYVALSYMWQQGGDNDHVQLEKKNLNTLQGTRGLANISLPNIISDTIALCRELGENYLWVDRLCIVQDDDRSKHSQIQAMDKIYRSATFTIMVATNTRDGMGLPGFKNRPRASSIWTPPRQKDEQHGVEPNGISTIVNPSLWNQRAWTFQERVMSRRRLFITESQVIYECSRGQAYEELTYCPQYPPLPEIHESEHEGKLKELELYRMPAFTERNPYEQTLNYNLSPSTSVVDCLRWIEEYTSRKLSFESDTFNAFSGVANALKKILDSDMIFGLPEKNLPEALMWSCDGLKERRCRLPESPYPIPSWSWASSYKRVDYHWIVHSSPFGRDVAYIVSLVYFHFQDPDVGLRKLDVAERWVQNKILIKEFKDRTEVPSIPRKDRPGLERSTRTWQECPHSPWQTLLHLALDAKACHIAGSRPGCLIFNTTVSSLDLKRDTRKKHLNRGISEQDVAIHNQHGDLVGWLNKMSLDWIDANVGNGKTHDFIVICGALADWRTRKHSVEWDFWRLHVMLVERLPSEAYLARRVGVGIIDAHKWKDCNPRWETVVLC